MVRNVALLYVRTCIANSQLTSAQLCSASALTQSHSADGKLAGDFVREWRRGRIYPLQSYIHQKQ